MGLAVSDLDGRVSKVIWPYGFHGVLDGNVRALVDGRGQLIGHVGDTIRGGGGHIAANDDPIDPILICSDIRAIR